MNVVNITVDTPRLGYPLLLGLGRTSVTICSHGVIGSPAQLRVWTPTVESRTSARAHQMGVALQLTPMGDFLFLPITPSSCTLVTDLLSSPTGYPRTGYYVFVAG
jgi:hypothetical protein